MLQQMMHTLPLPVHCVLQANAVPCHCCCKRCVIERHGSDLRSKQLTSLTRATPRCQTATMPKRSLAYLLNALARARDPLATTVR